MMQSGFDYSCSVMHRAGIFRWLKQLVILMWTLQQEWYWSGIFPNIYLFYQNFESQYENWLHLSRS